MSTKFLAGVGGLEHGTAAQVGILVEILARRCPARGGVAAQRHVDSLRVLRIDLDVVDEAVGQAVRCSHMPAVGTAALGRRIAADVGGQPALELQVGTREVAGVA